MASINIKQQGNNLSFSGELGSDSIVEEIEDAKESISRCDAQQPVKISISELSRYNSLCLSFLLCCLRHGHKHGKKVVFNKLPSEMNNMMEVYNLKQIMKKYTQ